MTQDFIMADEFCANHQLEISFIHSLKDHGMIETIFVDQVLCLYVEELPRLEQIVRLHRDLEVNIEGIEVINDLLERIEEMQEEIARLRKRLDLYEGITEQ
jgi:chaperone modulatory protein CbpM